MKTVLFAFAHLDDEAFGPAGTICKLAKSGHRVLVHIMCKGNRPGADWMVANNRRQAFHKNCRSLGVQVEVVGEHDDVHLDFHEAVKELAYYTEHWKVDTVYTHHIGDLHRDHRTVAEAAMVVCRPRPKSTVNELYMCEIGPSSDSAFGQFRPFEPNVFVDVSDYIDLKKQCLQNYSTEVHPFPDGRSIESMLALAQLRGGQVGVNSAEAFQLVFSRDHRNV